jgi:AraC-like DNA-binding protein
MILSRRSYRWGDATLEQQRALSPSWIVRRCRFEGIFEDERPLKTLGRDIDTTRVRMSIVLRGRVVAFVGNRSWELAEGQAIVAAPLSSLFMADVSSSIGVEVDWEGGFAEGFANRLRLSDGFLTTARDVAEALRTHDVPTFSQTAHRLFEYVAAEGLPIPDPDALDAIDHASQVGMSAVDAVLNELDQKPQLIDLEKRLGCSRWTLNRSLRQLNQTYGLCGLAGGTDWRAMRAFARLRVAGLLLTNPRATTRAIADTVGYRSPEAMCHAFSNAGLPSPGRLRAERLRSL